MFEVGKRYHFRMIEQGEETSFPGEVEKYEAPLVKVADRVFDGRGPYLTAGTVRGPIINTTSPNFISATIIDPRPDLDE